MPEEELALLMTVNKLYLMIQDVCSLFVCFVILSVTGNGSSSNLPEKGLGGPVDSASKLPAREIGESVDSPINLPDKDLGTSVDEVPNNLPDKELQDFVDSPINLPDKDLDKTVEMESNSCSQLAEGIKENLESLLDLLVDSTKGASIEMLERYYSALQCCIHKQRHSHDKTQLLKVRVCVVSRNVCKTKSHHH